MVDVATANITVVVVPSTGRRVARLTTETATGHGRQLADRGLVQVTLAAAAAAAVGAAAGAATAAGAAGAVGVGAVAARVPLSVGDLSQQPQTAFVDFPLAVNRRGHGRDCRGVRVAVRLGGADHRRVGLL